MNDFEDLLTALGEQRARQIVASIAPAHILNAFDRYCETQHALKLLKGGMVRRSVAYKLTAIYQLSLTVAYRRIDSALRVEKLYQQLPDSDTTSPEHWLHG